MKIKINKISQKIKTLREHHKITQETLAQKLGISRQSIISIEQGRCLPSLPLTIALAEAFEMSLDNFFIEEERREVSKMAQDIAPWSPIRELTSLHETIDRLFEESLPETITKIGVTIPSVNVFEKNNNVIVEADVPGVKEEDLSVEVGKDQITIRGERKTESEIKEKDYYRKETSFGAFHRTIPLPAEVDKDKAEAELKEGTLVVTLPKIAEMAPRTTKIKVKKA